MEVEGVGPVPRESVGREAKPVGPVDRGVALPPLLHLARVRPLQWACRVSPVADRVQLVACRVSPVAYRVQLVACRGQLVACRGQLVACRERELFQAWASFPG